MTRTTTTTTTVTGEDEPAPDDAAETVVCDGFCEREVYAAATVDVVAGAVVGEWELPEAHVGVAGVEADTPEVQHWCTTCADDWFGIARSAHDQRVATVRRYVTAGTIAAFLLGVALTLVVAMVLIV